LAIAILRVIIASPYHLLSSTPPFNTISTTTAFIVLSIATCPHTYRCRDPFLLLSGDIKLNPGPTNFTACTLNICSILTDSQFADLSGLTLSHAVIILIITICFTETRIKSTTTFTELAKRTPPNPAYSWL